VIVGDDVGLGLRRAPPEGAVLDALSLVLRNDDPFDLRPRSHAAAVTRIRPAVVMGTSAAGMSSQG
jgi:hypothetical protein